MIPPTYDEYADEFSLDDIESDEDFYLNEGLNTYAPPLSRFGGDVDQYEDIEDFDENTGIFNFISVPSRMYLWLIASSILIPFSSGTRSSSSVSRCPDTTPSQSACCSEYTFVC
jgi:hypothetical protein